MPYDATRDFTWVTMTARFNYALVTRNELPARSVAELLGAMKARPGGLTYASVGPGSPHHLQMALLLQITGTDATHVPYRGTPPALSDLMAGTVDFMLLDGMNAVIMGKAGKVKVLATVSPTRLTALPNVPTIEEAGVSNYGPYSWQGIVAPRGTPRAIVDRLNAEFKRAVADPVVKQKLTEAGIEIMNSTPEQFAEHAKAESVRWAEVIKKAGIRLD